MFAAENRLNFSYLHCLAHGHRLLLFLYSPPPFRPKPPSPQPLAKQKDFFLGRPDSDSYLVEERAKGKKDGGYDFMLALKGLKKLSPFKSASSEL